MTLSKPDSACYGGSIADLRSPLQLFRPTVANTIIVMSVYFAILTLVFPPTLYVTGFSFRRPPAG
jgi:hypothetical protein